MGKWSIYQKRGSTKGNRASPPPPPAPTLIAALNVITGYANGLFDAGGTFELWYSEDSGANWGVVVTVAWDYAYVWGAIDEFEAGLYRCTETGNHSVYQGPSLPSNTITVD